MFRDFSKVDSHALITCLRFDEYVAMFAADAGPSWIRFLLPCRTLSFPTTCRFISAFEEMAPPKGSRRIPRDQSSKLVGGPIETSRRVTGHLEVEQ